MIKQSVRGYVYFEDKTIGEVKRVFENFRFDEAKFKFFEKIKINNKQIINSGVFLNGFINEKYTSENVVRLFRKLMGLKIEMINCDVSIEREYEVEKLDKERPFTFYYALQFKKTEIKDLMEKFQKKISEKITIRTRDVAYKKGVLIGQLEIFSDINIDEKLNDLLLEEKIECDKIVKL